MLEMVFETDVIDWRGPAPFFFARVPEHHSEAIRSAAKRVSYGWGVIPASAIISGVAFTTSLFPKDGNYLLPLKDAVRRQCGITAGDTVVVEMTIGAPDR
ncbi:DUF1905 domain-containing protein [Pelagibacterium sp.]|uniref:DUF1905 domain-containing protein n=1 Tax=Pelagibacterium sp. TaxID=1967288 RepID=UPI003A92552E